MADAEREMSNNEKFLALASRIHLLEILVVASLSEAERCAALHSLESLRPDESERQPAFDAAMDNLREAVEALKGKGKRS